MLHLTPRDRALLTDVWRFRYLTARQVARLHFHQQAKLAQRRLRLLHEAGLLDRFRPAEATHAGFRAWWYRLSRSGARYVAQDHGEALATVLPPKRVPRSLGFLAHHALVTDALVWLQEGCQSTPGFKLRFVPAFEEARVAGRRRRTVALPIGQRQLIPDAAIILTHEEGKSALFLLEADRGTEPLTGRHKSAIARKFATYRAAFDTRTDAHYHRLFSTTFTGFRILCLVPDETRQAHFLTLAGEHDLVPLVWVTTHDTLGEPGDLYAPVWDTAPDNAPRALSE